MKSLDRRQALARAFAAVATGALAGSMFRVRPARAEGDGRVIEIVAQRFTFTPNEIVLKRGEAVTLAIKSLDFPHGFNVPALGVRADLMPGQVTKVKLQPMQSGKIDFLCDNFCGDGHEKMHGRFVVQD